MWESAGRCFKSCELRPDEIGIPGTHAGPGLAATPRLPPPLSVARARSHPHVTSERDPREFPAPPSPTRRRTWPTLWAGGCPLPSRRASAPGCLGNGAHLGLPPAFYPSPGPPTGKSSPRVVATADGALLFPRVPRAAWCRVSGRLKKKRGRGERGHEKLAKGDIGSL